MTRWKNRLWKSIVAGIAAAILLCGLIGTASADDNPFTDVKSTDYFYWAVQWAVREKVTAGTTETTFSPNDTCSVAQILTFIWRSKDSPEPKISNPFRDVSSNAYYYKAALWAYENGMVSGSTFNGNAPCTRAAAVTYLWKLYGSLPADNSASFTDVPASVDYAKAVDWALEWGVTSGTTKTTFTPNNTCTRAQIVTFMYRAFEIGNPYHAFSSSRNSQFEHEGYTIYVDAANYGLPNHEASNLFDSNAATKWMKPLQRGTLFVEWHVSEAIPINIVQLETTTDTSIHPGRNPATWKLLGRNSKDEEWSEIYSIENDTFMEDKNITAYAHSIVIVDQNGNKIPFSYYPKYQYFRFEVSATQGAPIMQLSGINLRFEADS